MNKTNIKISFLFLLIIFALSCKIDTDNQNNIVSIDSVESEKNNDKWNIYYYKKLFNRLGYWGSYKENCDIYLKKIANNWTILGFKQSVGGNSGELSGYEWFYSIEQYQLGGFPNNVLKKQTTARSSR